MPTHQYPASPLQECTEPLLSSPKNVSSMLLPDHSRKVFAAPVVELRAARIPIIGFFAHHHWFVVVRSGRRDRWEVWQHANVGGDFSVGYLHKNLLPPDAGVGNGPSWVIQCWRGEVTRTLASRIESSPDTYPWCFKYRYWPGPNSNTFVQWVLGEEFQLGRCAVGRGYGGCFSGRLPDQRRQRNNAR